MTGYCMSIFTPREGALRLSFLVAIAASYTSGIITRRRLARTGETRLIGHCRLQYRDLECNVWLHYG